MKDIRLTTTAISPVYHIDIHACTLLKIQTLKVQQHCVSYILCYLDIVRFNNRFYFCVKICFGNRK